MDEADVTHGNCIHVCRSVYTRHLKTCVWGGVAVTLVTLLLYAPTPATLSYTPTHPLSGDSGAGEMAEGEGGEMPLALLALTCTPTTHLLFLKTHKCASTTVQNILFRFGYSRNLTFALPDAGNYLGNPSFFQAKMLPRRLVPIGGKVDIFAVHSRLNFLEHARVLHGDAKWLTVVREPAALYESLYNFYNMHNTYGFGLDKFGKKSMRELASLPRFGSKLGRNQMLFDLGYSENLTVSDLRRAMDDLDHTFNQVLIAEKMDESLILLRHLLCWSLSDVVVLTKNARRSEVKRPLDSSTLAALRELNSADVILYEHFLAKHKERVHLFGEERMSGEIQALHELRDEYFDECGLKEVKGKDNSLKFKEYSGQVSAYLANNTSDSKCLLLTLPELPLVDLARKKQVRMLELEVRKVPPPPPPLLRLSPPRKGNSRSSSSSSSSSSSKNYRIPPS